MGGLRLRQDRRTLEHRIVKEHPPPDRRCFAPPATLPTRFAGGGISALAAGIALLVCAFTSPALAQSPEPEARSFRGYIESLRPLAQQRGVTPATPSTARSTNVPYDTEVSRLSRKQPEYGRPVGDYLNSLVAQPRLGNGIKRIGELRGLLDSIEHRFGVPREVIVAIWGIETSYGANQGGKRVIPSLATLAFHNYKGDFARDELITALLILQEGHIPPERMIGSWAGAMGQPQFIASSFMRWAVDFSGDGKRDLWTSVPDVLASIANYLKRTWLAARTALGLSGAGARRLRLSQEPRLVPRMGDARLQAHRWRQSADHHYARRGDAAVSVRRARACLSGHEEFRGDQDLQYLGCLRARGAPPRRSLPRRAAVRRPLARQRRAALARGPDDAFSRSWRRRASSRTTCRA